MEKDLMISLKAARVNAGMTITEAAKKIGVDRTTLMKWEHGETVPNWEKVDLIGKVYRFPTNHIIFCRKT